MIKPLPVFFIRINKAENFNYSGVFMDFGDILEQWNGMQKNAAKRNKKGAQVSHKKAHKFLTKRQMRRLQKKKLTRIYAANKTNRV